MSGSKKGKKHGKQAKYSPSSALYIYENTTILPRLILGLFALLIMITMVSAASYVAPPVEPLPEETPLESVEPSALPSTLPAVSESPEVVVSEPPEVTEEPDDVNEQTPSASPETPKTTDNAEESEPSEEIPEESPPPEEIPVETYTLPILKLHHIVMDGETVEGDAITLSKFTELLARLAGAGYTTIGTNELLDFVNGSGELPEKPVMITFDDGYESNYTLAYPMLKEFNMKSIISVIGWSMGRFTNNDGISPIIQHVSWSQMSEMLASGLVEVGNHTYNMHGVTYNGSGRAGVLRQSDESVEEYEAALKEDIGKLQSLISEKLGVTGKLFCYPYGKGDKETERLLSEMGFNITLSTVTGVNTIERGSSLGQLKREDVSQDTDLAALIEKWK